MFRSSSIFSFDTLAGLPRLTRSFWLAAGICLTLRLLMAAAGDQLERIPAHCTNRRLMYLEQTLVRANPTPPKVLLMGSSLMRYGLIEDQVAAAAGVPPGQVVNLALENGSAWDALVLLRRNPKLAASARLIIYAIHPGEINPGSRARWIDNYYQLSTLGEKLIADRWSDRLRLVLDWAWPYQSQRRDLVTWLAGLGGQTGYTDPDGLRPAWNPGLFQRLKARSPIYQRPPAPEDLAGIDVRVSGQHLRHLTDFIDFCRQRGIRLHLLTTPTRRVYDRVVASTDSLRAGLSQFELLLDSLGVGASLFHKPPARLAIGLNDKEDFLDYCHLTPDGARKLTLAVAADLQARGILPLPAGPAAGPTLTRAPAEMIPSQ